MLTNFPTISRRLLRLPRAARDGRSGAMDYLPKKEVIRLRHEREKLERNLGGIQDLERLPDAVFVVDTKKEHIAVTEARKLGIPVIAIVDTNCDPDEVDYVIPGNDDAIRAVSLVARVVADALAEGLRDGQGARSSRSGREAAPTAARPPVRDRRAGRPRTKTPVAPRTRPRSRRVTVFEPDAPRARRRSPRSSPRPERPPRTAAGRVASEDERLMTRSPPAR